MDIVISSGAVALVVASWVIGVRIVYKMSRDLAVISQRLAYLEGRLNGRPGGNVGEE